MQERTFSSSVRTHDDSNREVELDPGTRGKALELRKRHVVYEFVEIASLELRLDQLHQNFDRRHFARPSAIALVCAAINDGGNALPIINAIDSLP